MNRAAVSIGSGATGTASGVSIGAGLTQVGAGAGTSARVIGPTGAESSREKSVENAVYGHIRALRALGRTRVETAEVAKSLGLSIAEVHATLKSLKRKGVKLLE